MACTIRDNIPHGTARGNTCYICGAAQRESMQGDKEKIIDSGITIDMEGYLMFCETCMLEVGEKLGMLSKAHTAEALEKLEELSIENARLKAELSLQEDLVTSVLRLKDFRTPVKVQEGE